MRTLTVVVLLLSGVGCGDGDSGGDAVDGGAVGVDATTASSDATTPVIDAMTASDAGESSAFTVPGQVVGTSVPSSAKVVVLWSVSTGSPDYLYKYGEGASTNTQFMVAFPDDPPDEAINSHGIGVGLVVMVPTDAQIPEGVVDADQLEILGMSGRHAIIWRGNGPGLDWSPAFPVGYDCGRCVPAPMGEFYDSFEPVDCSLLEIDTDIGTLSGCNWT